MLVIRAPSLLNPTLDPRIIEEALDADPAAAKAEWLAEFRDDIGGWASVELIEAAVDRGVSVRLPVKGPGMFLFAIPAVAPATALRRRLRIPRVASRCSTR